MVRFYGEIKELNFELFETRSRLSMILHDKGLTKMNKVVSGCGRDSSDMCVRLSNYHVAPCLLFKQSF